MLRFKEEDQSPYQVQIKVQIKNFGLRFTSWIKDVDPRSKSMKKERSKSMSMVHNNQDYAKGTGRVLRSRFNIQIPKPV